MVVNSCGHDRLFKAIGVKRLKSIDMIDIVLGMKALDMNVVEDAIVRLTREIVLRMIVTRWKSSRLMEHQEWYISLFSCSFVCHIHLPKCAINL